MKTELRNREISWLSFNGRVLQEAADASVPLLERVTFLGIFSSNLDEFFRVRVAVLKRLAQLGKPVRQMIGDDPKKILKKIHRIVLRQQADFEDIYQHILQELAQAHIYIIDETQLTDEQEAYVKTYVRQNVRPVLTPLMINHLADLPELKDHAIYLAVCLSHQCDQETADYALIEVPTEVLPRFLVLPSDTDNYFIILLEDINDDVAESYIRKISNSLRQRKFGMPVRFVYDSDMPEHLLRFLVKKLKLRKADSNFIPGGKYHNFKDFMHFPRVGDADLRYPPLVPLPRQEFAPDTSMFQDIEKRDILLHYPYHAFDYLIDLLREAAIDPHVTHIKMTLYRVARHSQVVNALINAANNGKIVTVVMELQARFDEAHNVRMAHALQEEGVRVIDGVPGLKVHAKLLLITRKVRKKTVLYASIGTGNFNETTAKVYTDHSLFTTDTRLTSEVKKVFAFLENNYKHTTFQHLLVSPFNMRQKLIRLINREIKQAQRGHAAYIILKTNNLEDRQLIKKLYAASQAGVDVRLMVRGMFSLIPGVKEMSERIHASCIVDRFLEHSRLMVFCAGGAEAYYLSSADWMRRNMDNRVEVACPLYDPNLQQEVKDYLDIQWRDTGKARILNQKLDNQYHTLPDGEKIRAQEALYTYFKAQSGIID
jgi:polyphosphate kinase